MIDWGRVRDLRMEIGADDFSEVIALFLEEADDVVCRLENLTDARAIEGCLHFLKGSALNLGFAALAQICQTGEKRAASGMTNMPLQDVAKIYQASRQAFVCGIREMAA
jgi:histidine phosphotransfer protein HptB